MSVGRLSLFYLPWTGGLFCQWDHQTRPPVTHTSHYALRYSSQRPSLNSCFWASEREVLLLLLLLFFLMFIFERETECKWRRGRKKGKRELFFITQIPFDYPDITRGSRHWNQRKKRKILHQMTRDWDLSCPCSQKCLVMSKAQENAIQASNIKKHLCGLWRDKHLIPQNLLWVPHLLTLELVFQGSLSIKKLMPSPQIPETKMGSRGKKQLWSRPQVISEKRWTVVVLNNLFKILIISTKMFP